MASTTISVGTTTYTSAQRAAGGWVGIDSLKISVDEYWELEFTIYQCGSNPPFLSGEQVIVQVDQGAGPATVFTGNITGYPIKHEADSAWNYGYHCTDLKRRGDLISIQDPYGQSAFQFNLPVDDNDYDPAYSGFTVGQIVAAVLQVYNTASNLQSLNVGNFTFAAGPPATATLAAITLLDLANLTIVPNVDVRIEGEFILQVLDGFVKQWYPQYGSYVDAVGNIRYVSPFNFYTSTVNLYVPGAGVTSPSPVDLPEYTINTDGCFTQYQIIGQDFDGAVVSIADGTLTPVNSPTDRSKWNINYHLYPSGTATYGSLSVTSSTSCTITCDDPTISWPSGFWPANNGYIWLVDTSGADVTGVTRRPITISAALSPGGSCDIEWSSDTPLDYSSYTRFMIVGQNNPLSFVDRLFWITDPWSGDTGLNTYLGSHLVNRDPAGIPWSNNDQFVPIFYATAKILWSINGDNANPALRWPIQELPVGVRVIKQTGQILLDDPACFIAALAAGTEDALLNGYPSTALGGLWYDIRVVVPFSRGPLVAKYPASGFAGSAYTDYGIQRIKQVFLDSYTSSSQNAMMVALATQRAITLQDAVIKGTIFHHGLPAGFNAFEPGYALQIVMPTTSPIDGIPIPVRTTVIRWPNEAADIYQVSFRFSNQKQPFTGDSRYIHPNYTRDPSDTIFYANDMGGFGPGFGMADFRSGMEGREARQAKRREDQGFAPNTAGGFQKTDWNKLSSGPESAPAGRPINVDDSTKKLAERRGLRTDTATGGAGGAP
jgi:hypothetical protein